MDQEKQPGLFGEFPPVSTQAWEEKIQADLKGADYEKRLVWKTPEGLKVRPYYRAEHLEDLPHMGILPGEAPFVRGNKTQGNHWVIRQDFEETDPSRANTLVKEAIAKGAEAVGLNVSEIDSAAGMSALLDGIDAEKTGIHLIRSKHYPSSFTYLTESLGNAKARGSLNFDPLGYYLLYSRFYNGQEADLEQGKDLIEQAKAQLPHFHVITVNGQHCQNAGAGIVQELAFALAQGNEYLVHLTGLGLKADDIAPRIQFTLATGSAYFMEIAKFRAARMLWTKIVEQYGLSDPKNSYMYIHAVTSNWNKSVYDPYVNMLRTTTEAMAASIGGADSMTVNPFDKPFKKPDAFSYRMARNQQIILREEAYFGKVADPAAGSYYVEQLTHDIASAAWGLFLDIEEQGGFLKTAQNGFIRASIEDTCQKRDMDIAMRKQVFVGTNLYPNTEETVLDKIQPAAELTALAGLRQYRGTQAFEALRMAVENHVGKGFEAPKVFLLTYGNLAMRKARAGFSGNFFGVAGYRIVDNLGFPDVDSGVKAALDSKAEIVVLCSSDEEYAELAAAPIAIKKAAPGTRVVVAGNPKEIKDTLVEAGVDDFIHLRTNVLESLSGFNAFLGIA